MTTRRKKNNNNNKSKKVKKYINRNNTRKRSQTGGLAKIHHKTKKHILKNVTQFKKKAKGRRGIKVEFKFINALSEFLGDPTIPQKVKDRKDTTAKYDIDRNMSRRLRAAYSIKSVAQTSEGQTKFQICMGNTCRVFESFSQASDPLEMAIIIRYEHMIESGQIPLSTAVYDMHKYKPTLFGNLSDGEIKKYRAEVNRLEELAKDKTYDAFKPYAGYAPDPVIAEAKKAKEHINQSLTGINNVINGRGGKLVVRLSDANWFKRRPPRIVSHWDYSPNSPRILDTITDDSRAIAAMPDLQQLTDSGSMSAESGKGSAAVAAATVQRPLVPRRLLLPSPSRSSIRKSSVKRPHRSRSSDRPSSDTAGPARPSNVAPGPAIASSATAGPATGIAKPKLPMIPEGSKYSEIDVSNLLQGEYPRLLRYRPSTPSGSIQTRSSSFYRPRLRSSTKVPTASGTEL
jgi:hypothetical protein